MFSLKETEGTGCVQQRGEIKLGNEGRHTRLWEKSLCPSPHHKPPCQPQIPGSSPKTFSPTRRGNFFEKNPITTSKGTGLHSLQSALKPHSNPGFSCVSPFLWNPTLQAPSRPLVSSKSTFLQSVSLPLPYSLTLPASLPPSPSADFHVLNMQV